MNQSKILIALAGFALAAATLSACSPPTGEEVRLERSVFQKVHDGQLADVEEHLEPAEQNNTVVHAALVQIQHDVIPARAPTRIDQIQWSVTQVTGGTRNIDVVDRYTYPDRVLDVQTAIQIPSSGPYVLLGFHVQAASASVAANAAASSFAFSGKSLHQIVFFGVFVAVVILMIATVIGVIFTKGFKRKWLWVIIALCGAPVYTMNWTTGIWEPSFVLGLIDAGITRGPSVLDPWIITFHVPIGAFITLFFLIRRWTGYGPDN